MKPAAITQRDRKFIKMACHIARLKLDLFNKWAPKTDKTQS